MLRERSLTITISSLKWRGGIDMKVTLELDETLLNEALQLTNLCTQEELIKLALQELIQSRRKKNLLDLAGQIQFAPDFDYKALRERFHVAD